MSGLIEIYSNNPEYLNVLESNSFGGRIYSISLSKDIIDMIVWFKNEQHRITTEQHLRSSYTSVEDAYQQYQTILKLVSDN